MMKRAMLNKFTNFIQQTVDAFSPNIVPQEEFVYHWKSVTSYFLDNKDVGVRIEETALPEHLSSMLRVLQEEEVAGYEEAGTTGACLEYLLQHRLLETLYTLGRTDHPPGMKQIVLSFFTKLLSRISHPLLPHINVHRAIQRMVKACGEMRAAPTEKEEIEFLCTVCAKIKADPYLVNFFIESPKKSSESDVQSQSSRPSQAFSLVDALLTLSHSEDARVSVKACEGLMLCASLPEHSAAAAMIQHTEFCQTLSSILSQCYQKLPEIVAPEDIMMCEAKWGFDDVLERNDKNNFQGKGRLISFLSWLDYCDQLIAVANPAVGEALAEEIHKELLSGHVQAHLMQPSESGAIITTFYINRCLRTVNSPTLLKEFCFFLLGKDRSVELKDNSQQHPVHKRLLERCNHVSEEVCLATLKLFDTLLQKEEEHINHCLLIRNLLGRNYIEETSNLEDVDGDVHTEKRSDRGSSSEKNLPSVNPEKEESSSLDKTGSSSTTDEGSVIEKTEESGNGNKPVESEAKENNLEALERVNAISAEENKSCDVQEDSAKSPSDVEIAAKEESDVCKTGETSQSSKSGDTNTEAKSETFEKSSSGSPYGRSEVHKVVNCFLSLLPEEAKSSYQTADTGYDMYLRDAHKQYAIQETVCKSWNWPKRPIAVKEFATVPFFEGSFIHMLLDKLWHLLDQSYSVNLLLTALIARVALVPHPNLHEFLMEPFLPTVKGTRTLYMVLLKVVNDIKHHQKTDPAFLQKLLMARKQLLGIVPTIHRFEDQGRMEAIIVLEEFCKELSAIAFVKHHAAVTRV